MANRRDLLLFLFLGCQLAFVHNHQGRRLKNSFLSHKAIQLHQNIHKGGIFPFPVAGDTSRVEPDTRSPAKGLGNIAGGLGIASVAEAIEKMLSTAQKWDFGLVMYILGVSLIALVPFAWFSFAGGATPVAKWFNGLGVAFGLQTLVLALCVNVHAPNAVSISLALVAAAAGFASGFLNKPANFSWGFIVFFSSLLATNLAFTLFAPFLGTPHVAVYWSILLVIAIVLSVALLVYLPVKGPLIDGSVIAFFCSYGVVSCISSILIAFQIQAPFDFLTFFALPSSFEYTVVSCYLLLLLWAISTTIGIYIHALRAKQRR